MTTRFVATAWRVVWGALRRFYTNQGSLRAAGLTYLTLMSLVPGLTVVLVIASAFGIKQQMRRYLDQLLEGQSAKLIELKDNVMTIVDGVSLEVIGAAGLLVFIWVCLSLLSYVEEALNVTWEAGRSRTLARRYADYVAIILFVPLLVLAATAVKAVVTVDTLLGFWPWLRRLVESGLAYVPFLLIWAAMMLLYKVMPNVAVRWRPAAFSALVASISWIVAQNLFLRFQIELSRTNAIYGSVALLPVLLFYIYLSWTIVLLGAELNHAIQKRGRLAAPKDDPIWTSAFKRRIALTIMRRALALHSAGKAMSLTDLSSETGWPETRLDEIANILVDGGLLHRVRLSHAVVPAFPPGRIELQTLLRVVDGEDGETSRPLLVAGDEDLLADLRRRLTDISGLL